MGSATSSTHAKKKVVDPRTQLYIKPSPRAPETDGAAMATTPCSAMELKLKVRKTPGLDLQSAAVAALKLPLTLAGVLPAWTAKQLAAEAEVAFCAAGLVIQVRRCFFLFFFLGGATSCVYLSAVLEETSKTPALVCRCRTLCLQ